MPNKRTKRNKNRKRHQVNGQAGQADKQAPSLDPHSQINGKCHDNSADSILEAPPPFLHLSCACDNFLVNNIFDQNPNYYNGGKWPFWRGKILTDFLESDSETSELAEQELSQRELEPINSEDEEQHLS